MLGKNGKLWWNIWGVQIGFDAPAYEIGFNYSDASINQEPGKELLGFYDFAYFVSDGGRYDINDVSDSDSSLSFDIHDSGMNVFFKKMKDKYESANIDNTIFVRERFRNSWMVNFQKENYELLMLGDVYRDSNCGNLYVTDNLKKSHIKLLAARNQYVSANQSSDGYHYKTHYDGLDWRCRDVNGYLWQGYDVFDGYGKSAEVWLFPLSDIHYLALRIGVAHSGIRYREYVEHLQKFIGQVFNNMHIQVTDNLSFSQVLKRNCTLPVCVVTPEQLGYEGNDLIIWRSLNSRQVIDKSIFDMQVMKKNIKQHLYDFIENSSFRFLAYVLCFIFFVVGALVYQDYLVAIGMPGWAFAYGLGFLILYGLLKKLDKKIHLIENGDDS